MTPIFKKVDKHKLVNYRPISLTSLLCKAAEHIIHSKIIRHLDDHNLLTEIQFRFRKKRSCDSQLLITVDDPTRGLQDKQQIDAVLLDFSKAFDRVPHERLLLKIHHYGLRGQLLSWIRYFSIRTYPASHFGRIIEQRRQCHIMDTPRHCIGALGLLFLVFINDLPVCVSSSIRLFADDALLYK